MRVIAGKFRSRPLKGPGALRLRPTSDRLRETLFNVLGPSLEDSLFVDLFAGTGAVGIEAISRGAERAFFLEKHPATAKLIRKNIDALGIGDVTEVLEGDVAEQVLAFLDASHLIAPRGIVIVEHYRKTELPEFLTRLECTRQIEQGDAILSFYTLAAAA